VTGPCYAVSTILGGALVDRYSRWEFSLGEGQCLGFFPCVFVVGWMLRSLGALVLTLVIEPVGRRADDC
jgi:hypothetical protein